MNGKNACDAAFYQPGDVATERAAHRRRARRPQGTWRVRAVLHLELAERFVGRKKIVSATAVAAAAAAPSSSHHLVIAAPQLSPQRTAARVRWAVAKHLQLCAGKVRLRRLARPTHGSAVRDDPSASSRTPGRARMRRQRSPKPTSNRRSHISAQMLQLNCATPACDRESSKAISRTADSMVQSIGPKSQWIRSFAGLFRNPL